MLLFHQIFSHIYIENQAAELPLTRKILSRFPKANRIAIDDYKEVFNRRNQDWRAQKASPKLILARKKDGFLYAGTEILPQFNQTNFFYNTLVMNCAYDCAYCYLQGMYPSANTVIFTNVDDFFEATTAKLREVGSMYLAISYDTDLLATENIHSYCSNWMEYCKQHPNLTIELRTKSANISSISSIEPPQNAILAWTISPAEVIKKYEMKTPRLEARLEAARKAIAAGWKVRLCIDPILALPNQHGAYLRLIEQVFELLPANEVLDLSLGFFRMNSEYLRRIQKQRQDTDVIYYPWERNGEVLTYPKKFRMKLIAELKEHCQNYLPSDRIFVHMVQ